MTTGLGAIWLNKAHTGSNRGLAEVVLAFGLVAGVWVTWRAVIDGRAVELHSCH